MARVAEQQGQWKVYHVETGEEFIRWPIDAKDMVASGMYTFTPPGADKEITVEQLNAPPIAGEVPRKVVRSDEAPRATPLSAPTRSRGKAR